MLEESVTHNIDILIFTAEFAFVEGEVAFATISLIQILARFQLEDVIGHLKSDGFNGLGDFSTRFITSTESLIGFAVDTTGYLFLPGVLEMGENAWWNRHLGSSGINNRWVAKLGTIHGLAVVVDLLALESPSTEEIFEAWEGFEAFGSSQNLSGIDATEKGVGAVHHIVGCDTEADHGSADDALVFECPQVMKLSLFLIFVWRQPKNTIRILFETLGLVKCQEFKRSTFALLQLFTRGVSADLLETSLILPDEALEVSGAVGKF